MRFTIFSKIIYFFILSCVGGPKLCQPNRAPATMITIMVSLVTFFSAYVSCKHSLVKLFVAVVEIIELEAAKTVASAFDSDDLSNEAKVVVMYSVMIQYLKVYETSGDLNSAGGKRATSEARYDLLTIVLDSGLEAAAHIDSNTDEKDVLDFVWDRIIATVSSLLLPPADYLYDGYAHHSKSIVNIVAIFLTHLPPRKMSVAEPVLENGANRAVDAAFSCNEINQDDKDVLYLQASEGAM